jgi:hypothetical protein
MRLRPLACAALAVLTLPLPALASAWDPSFPAPAVASYLPAEAGTIVVGAGAASSDLADVEAALAAALRAGGKAKLVMDDAALGDVSALDDAAIVAKAKSLPAPRIAVARVFPGADGAAPTAVVTFYDRDGNAAGAFSVERGAALAANAAPAAEGPGQGASAAAVQAVAQVGKAVSTAAAEAQEKYDREFVWFENWAAVSANSGVVMSTWSVPYQGKYKKNIDGPEFYEVVGRHDLAEEYRSSDHWKTGWMIGGGVLTLGGAALMVTSLMTMGGCDIDDTACEDSSMNQLIAGSAAMVGGGIGFLVSAAINPHPVDLAEARRLADEHNQKLKKDLGLAARDEEPTGGIHAGLAALPGGAGLVLSGTLP